MHKFFYGFLCVWIATLVACGFKLKGQWQFNQQLNPLYLDLAQGAQGTDQLNVCLVRQLSNAGIILVNTLQDKTASLVLKDIQQSKTQISDNQISAKEYALRLSASIHLVRMDDGKLVELLPVQGLMSSKRLMQDTNQVNAALAEEEVLFQDLQSDLCWQAMAYLQSFSWLSSDQAILHSEVH